MTRWTCRQCGDQVEAATPGESGQVECPICGTPRTLPAAGAGAPAHHRSDALRAVEARTQAIGQSSVPVKVVPSTTKTLKATIALSGLSTFVLFVALVFIGAYTAESGGSIFGTAMTLLVLILLVASIATFLVACFVRWWDHGY